jgi:ribosomal protein S18 acetylase RimI-like enzyme
MAATGTGLTIRWMIRSDTENLLAIEFDSFDDPWDEDELAAYRRINTAVTVVAEYGSDMVGYCCYRLHRNWIQIDNLAVRLEDRRKGVATTLLASIAGKLSWNRRHLIGGMVRETNLPAQQILKACSWRCLSTYPRHFSNDEDGYWMIYGLATNGSVYAASGHGQGVRNF